MSDLLSNLGESPGHTKLDRQTSQASMAASSKQSRVGTKYSPEQQDEEVSKLISK